MGLMIVMLLIIVVTTVTTGRNLYGGFMDYLLGFLLGIVSSIFAGLFLFGMSFLYDTESVKVSSIEISALKDNSKVDGSFFLGSGYLSGEQYYFFIEATEKGKRMNKVEASKSYVNEVADTQPRVDTYNEKFVSWFPKFMYGEYGIGQEYVFYVPSDTVTTEFKIDME